MSILIIALSGMFAGVLSGIVGTGSSIILLPILVAVFGTKAAIPIMAIAALIANCGRVIVWCSEINWRAVFFYAVPSIPMAALGANLLIAIPESVGSTILGLFFLVLIPVRYLLRSRNIGSKPAHLVLGGTLIGFLTGLVASSGPLSLAVFSSFGLVKSALIATEAAASLFVFGSKAVTFSYLNVMSTDILIGGALVGGSITLGTYAAKAILNKLSSKQHDRMIDLVLAGSGISMIMP
ncbi:sulfite exporter TauE/SafE family protein [Pseudovibrio sp. FO-BEG1]|uniref:sulfite exporter TauE/SafE family protein n=1 Tax=Pseudovibrio sp. (strain FO-BEG1) TaxID=911045 RepID=UPI001305360C|nr:sulfite exporter TauE/SafE family protein [Pseudovibrio sp. FO-BEG1]